MLSKDATTHPLHKTEVILFALLAGTLPLGYALYTNHIWEDFFITFRHSQNLCEGHGLVYNVGERVHGFTSPLGVLLPALCYTITGQTSYGAGLWLFRVLAIGAFVAGGLFVLKSLARGPTISRLVPYTFGLLYVLEIKSVAYSVNGQETAFVLFFLGWALSMLQGEGWRNWPAGGVCWAGLLWTRPDGGIYLAALVLAHLTFYPEDRWAKIRALVQSGAVALIVYLPWLAWAWHYYGSPVPNTIWAKAPETPGPFALGPFLLNLYTQFPHRAAQVFCPIYYPSIWNQPGWIGTCGYGLGIFCAVYWLLPTVDRLGRMASLAFVLLTLYFAYMPYLFPWYCPPAALCGLVVLARGTSTLLQGAIRSVRGSHLLAAGVLVMVAGEMACVFALTSRQMRIQEKEVEMGNRVQVGLWLKDHVRPQETVFLEPVGYIGYFSQAHIIDYPGLVSPQVVRLRRHEHLNFLSLIGPLQPDWAVLRPWEATAMVNSNRFFRDHYEEVQRFDVTARWQKYRPILGEPYLVSDSVFVIFRKKERTPDPSAVASGRSD